MASRCSFVLICALAGGVACQGPESQPELVTCADLAGSSERPDIPLSYATQHLDIHVDDQRFMCAGSARQLDRFYQSVGDELELELEQVIPVYVLNPGTLSDYCENSSGGCRGNDGVVFVSGAGFVHHELVHAATCEWGVRSSQALEEGLAVAFEPEYLTNKVDPVSNLERDHSTRASYTAVGHFSRWLLEMYGPQAYREAFRASPYDGGPEALAVLEQVYGQPIDTLVATYLDDAPELWLPYFQCEGVERLEPGPEADSWRFESEFDCDDEATFGPWERSWAGSTDVEYRMYQSFLIEIETPGEYRFAREQDNTNIRLERCFEVAGGDEDQLDPLGFQQGLFATLQGYTDVELSPGTYRVDVLREVQPAHTVSVTIAPTPEP